MTQLSPPHFHRFWIINTFIATIFWYIYLYMWGLEWTVKYWEEFIWAITLFGLLSFVLFSWKSWKYSITDTSFSSLRAGLKISLSWIVVWDIFLIADIILSYFRSEGHCSGIIDWGPLPTCEYWEFPFQNFWSLLELIWILLLLVLPIIFWITGFYLDRRKNKATFPWFGVNLFIGIIILLILVGVIWSFYL